MMSRMTVGLLWKEARQLLPLIFILAAVGTLLLFVWGSFRFSSASLRIAGQYIPLILPALYAVGAGAVLVGQEKELKTIWWLAAFPVSPTKLFWVKFIVGLAGLVVMWLACLVLLAMGGTPSISASNQIFPADDHNVVDLTFLQNHSLYLLACGFFTSWRWRRTSPSLIAILPVAIVPFFLVGTGYWIREAVGGGTRVPETASIAVMHGVTLAATFIVILLAWRAANQVLSPQQPPSTRTSLASLDIWKPPAATVSAEPFGSSIASLVWLTIHHNRRVLVSLIAVAVVGLISMAWLATSESRTNVAWMLLGALGFPLAISWVGVFSFSGDASPQQIRFLAERGVSATRAWIAIQLVGLGMVSLFVLLYALGSFAVVGQQGDDRLFPIPSVAVFALASLLTYGISQWISQQLRIIAASACVAPLVSLMAVYWLGYAAAELSAPLWLVVLCVFVPLVITWIVMHRYMDGALGVSGWSVNVLGWAMLALVPFIPITFKFASFPRIDPERRATLAAEAKSIASSRFGSPMIEVGTNEYFDDPTAGKSSLTSDEALAALQRRDERLREPFPGLQQSIGQPGSIGQGRLFETFGKATQAWLQFQSDGSEESLDRLGQLIERLTWIAIRLRQSNNGFNALMDQEFALEIEIWLTQILSTDEMQSELDRPFARSALQLIGDQQGRNQARRIATLSHWNQTRGYGPGGMKMNQPTDTQRSMLARLHRDAVVDAKISILEAGAAGRPVEPFLQDLHRLIVSDDVAFEDGPYSNRFRASANGGPRMPRYQTFLMSYPASQWFAPWEKEAKQLAESQLAGPSNQREVNP